MTHFERDYLLNQQRPIIQSLNKEVDLTNALAANREKFALQMNYRELDRLTAELERELNLVKTIRTELEKYKVEFNLQIQDEATKKIQEVVNSINKMFI